MKLKDENEYRYDMDSQVKDARIHIRKMSQTSNQKDTMTMRTPSYIILDISLSSATNKEDKYDSYNIYLLASFIALSERTAR